MQLAHVAARTDWGVQLYRGAQPITAHIGLIRGMCRGFCTLAHFIIGRLHYCVGLVGDFPTGNSKLFDSSREEFVAGFIGETL